MYQIGYVQRGEFEAGTFHPTAEAALAACKSKFREPGVTYVDAEELTSDGGFRRVYRRRTIGQTVSDIARSAAYHVRCAILKAQGEL